MKLVKILLSVLIISITSCVMNEELLDFEIKTETILIKNAPGLIKILTIGTSQFDKDVIFGANTYAVQNKISLVLDSVVRVFNPETNMTRWTLLINNSEFQNPFAFQNLIITKGTQITGHIVQFEPDINWGVQNMENSFSLDKYTGYISLYSLQGKLLLETYHLDGMKQADGPSGLFGVSGDCDGCDITSQSGSFPAHFDHHVNVSCEDGSFTSVELTMADDCAIYLSSEQGGSGSGQGDSTYSGEGPVGVNPDGNSFDEFDYGSGGGGSGAEVYDDPIGVLSSQELLIREELGDIIEITTDPETKMRLQLAYIFEYGEEEDKVFVEIVEAYFDMPGLTLEDAYEMYAVVQSATNRLMNNYFLAIFGSVTEMARPFIELGLTNSLTNVAFQGIGQILKSKWGIDFVNSIKSTRILPSTKVVFYRLPTKYPEFKVGLTNTEFKVGLKNSTGKTWQATSHPEIFTLEHNSIHYATRPFSNSAGSTVDVSAIVIDLRTGVKSKKLVSKYRLLD